MTRPLSGTQYELSYGDYSAVIASVGASLRKLTHAGRDLVVPFEADAPRPAFRGAVLAPWPNRIADGRYTFAGVQQQVALTEPERGNALHGLVAWLDFGAIEQTPSRVTLGATIQAQQGYPHRVDVEVVYELTADGLFSQVTGSNSGADAAPWGTGPHPYLVAGDAVRPNAVNEWTLLLPADRVLEVTPDRLLPTGTRPVSEQGGAFDFRETRAIGDVFIDHAFTGLATDASGRTRVEVRAADGSGTAISWDAACPWVQVHTADLPDPRVTRQGLAVEPMTCPPDAFNSGTDLVVLEPGAAHAAGWTISAL
ncbi:aldose 1-epimerase family protein [Gryllotalpicola ginsengisoli]|uniref:aldose 1-epimerase family protein n=1 Tax=Gryllotalpicola ginsengisoli TaxID=444608 RepID=UPI0003B70D04|nr:aldose 1-epimerase family protein [Gryllotalpicola ginsengisoli]